MRHAFFRRVGIVTLVGAMMLIGNTYTASAGKPAPPPPPPPAGPRVVDANNVVVGQVMGATGQVLSQTFTPSPYYAVVALNISVPSVVVQGHL